MTVQTKRLGGIVLSVFLLLLVPFVAMQFDASVHWTARDFIVAGILLSGTGLLCELALRFVQRRRLRIALCAGILLALVVIWAELAVGIFGTPLAGN